jgi:hypothetical protein
MTSGERIFVQIASYRDPECPHTIADLFARAARPERIFVGLCAQDDPGRDAHCKVPEHERVRRIEVPAAESRGVCWARSQVQSLWRGEEFTLLTDSHMRFAQGWDEKLIAELGECASEKPLLSCNPPRYDPPDKLEAKPTPSIRGMNPFASDGALRGRTIRLDRFPDKPLNGAFIACGFVFSKSDLISEVPYDPWLYFSQEEVSLAARMWTHGWDIYSSRQIVLYHHYYDATRPLHWKDGDAWRRIDALAVKRFRHMVGMEQTSDPEALVELDKYGLGTRRSIADYEEYSGLHFSRREVTLKAQNCGFVNELHKYKPSLVPKARPRGGTDYFAPFELPNQDGNPVRLDFYGGKPLLISWMPAGRREALLALLKAARANHGKLDLQGVDCIIVSGEPSETNKALRDEAQCLYRVASGPDCHFATAEPRSYLLGPGFKLQRSYEGDPFAPVLAEPPPTLQRPIVVEAQAPVAMVPDVLSQGLCDELISLYGERTPRPGTVGLGAQNRVEPLIKQRGEYHLSPGRDKDLMQRIDQQLRRSLLPELLRVWRYSPTHRESYKLCCYESSNQGHYSAHRDNADPALRYRKLSLTINLNDDYEGGALHFPEYGPFHYRPRAGGAVVFSGVLLHRATPVTRNRRFMLVSFLFDEENGVKGPKDSLAWPNSG